jgi:hypothetical protein
VRGLGIFRGMRAALATTVLAVALAGSIAVPATAKPPSVRQIASAISAAEKSRSLWATINVCNSRTQRYGIGVRGQMPSLGFAAVMEMTIKLNYYFTSTGRFEPIDSPNAVDQVPIGTYAHGLRQGGTTWLFHKGQTGIWNATVVFTWKRNGKLLGQAQRTTTAGHPSADRGSPPHYSAAQCRIS